MSDPTSTGAVDLPAGARTPRLRRVYAHLATTDGESTREIAAALDLRPHALRPALAILDRRGLVREVDGGYAVRESDDR